MTVTKTQLADAYSAALNKQLAAEWGTKFSRKDANNLMDALWPVISDLALKDTRKATPGSVPMGPLGRLKMLKAKPATLQPRFTAGKPLKDAAAKHSSSKLK